MAAHIDRVPHEDTKRTPAHETQINPEEAIQTGTVSGRAALGAGPPDPNHLTPPAILGLQRRIGNRAVQRLLKSSQRAAVQRVEGEASSTEADADTAAAQPDALDAELDALLEEIGVTGQQPAVPSYEAITSTTAGEYSRGQLEQEIQRLWRRERLTFTQAARRAAEENTVGDRGPRAVQSPAQESETPYAHRWTVNLYAADYEQWSDLPDVARLMRRGSPFRQALAEEFDNVITVRDPTGSEMGDAIFDGIMGLAGTLRGSESGELVVTFSGHGGQGSISGVDGENLTPVDLRTYASIAQDAGVHVVYILDTCRAGIVANFAQHAAYSELEEAAGNLPEDQQSALQPGLDWLHTMGRQVALISVATHFVGDGARTYRRQRTGENFHSLFNSINGLITRVSNSQEALANSDYAIDNRDALDEQHTTTRLALIGAMDGNRGAIVRALRQTAILLDMIGDTVNTQLSAIRARMARTATEAQPE